MGSMSFMVFMAVVLYLTAVALLVSLSIASPALREVLQRAVKRSENDL